jgi:cytochrome c peroxidase
MSVTAVACRLLGCLVLVLARPVLAGGDYAAGDYKGGYETGNYATRSVALDTRANRARPADLMQAFSQTPLGLPPVPVPDDNPATEARLALGRKLFFDRRLSLNGTMSCAMCHVPEQGFANNELALAVGMEGRTVRRNAPTLYNVAYFKHLFHDGRENRLEQQVWLPTLAHNEMANPSVGEVLRKLGVLSDYRNLFEAAFDGRGPDMETVGAAIATYERALVSGNSPFDRWRYGGEQDALDASAKRGFALFTGKGGCVSCHLVGESTALFTDDDFHNTGIGWYASMQPGVTHRRVQLAPGVYQMVSTEIIADVSNPVEGDVGRYEITGDPADRWRYKTPTLRNVALTAPYMHDGSLQTLTDVVEFYNRGGQPNPGQDPRVHPLGLTATEVSDLVAFLESLTGDNVETLVADAFAAPIGDPGLGKPGDPVQRPAAPDE